MLLYVFSLLGLIFCSWKHGLTFFINNKFIEDIQGFSGIGDLAFAFLILFCTGYIFIIRKDKSNVAPLLKLAFAIPIVATISFPMFSSDLFAYFEFSRLILGYKMNPYLHGYSEIHDAYSSFAWFCRTSNYGPLAHLFSTPAAALSFVSPYAGFVCLKLTWLGLGLFALKQLKKLVSDFWFLVFALNPFWIIEVFINGHNDIIAVLLIILFLKSLLNQNENLAILYLAMLSLFKLPLGIFSLFFTIHFLSIKKWGLAIRLVVYNLISILILVFCLNGMTGIQIFLQGSTPYTAHSFWGHFITVIQNFILHDNEEKSLFILSAIVGLKPFSFVLILCLSYYFFISNPNEKIKSLGSGLCFFIYLIATQFWPWYALWALPIVAFAESKNLLNFFLFCSLSSLILYAPGYWISLEALSNFSFYELYKITIILVPVFGFLIGFSQYLRKELSDVFH